MRIAQLRTLVRRFAIGSLITLSAVCSAQVQKPILPGVQFGYAATKPLEEKIGPSATLTTRFLRTVGGVAFVRAATGQGGWLVTRMAYDDKAPDGQRLVVEFSKEGSAISTVRPSLWDWELLPLVRFVNSEFDAAFTFFGSRGDREGRGAVRWRALGYHPAFKDTLLGLRLMQLDLYLFFPGFLDFITNTAGEVLIGPGEAEALGWQRERFSPVARERHLRSNRDRLKRAQLFLSDHCVKNWSRICDELGQPFQSYVVGDTLSPVSFSINSGRLEFQTNGVCWDFSRPTEPDEASTPGLPGTLRLEALSKAFCSYVKNDLAGIYPLVYRAGNRALTFSALLRHFKRNDKAGFASLVSAIGSAPVPNAIATPTELMVP